MAMTPNLQRDLLIQTIRACEAELAVCQLNIALSQHRLPLIQRELERTVTALKEIEDDASRN